MKTLIIDSSDSKQIIVGLKIGSKKYILKHKTDAKKAQAILPLIDKIFKKYSIEAKDLDSITVNIGPGSFTGLRVGISIANTLGFILKIPVNDKNAGELVEPYYK
ncbi:MAG: tRNA (adenosine(37)-N6)-threonylcarbamoyltransferase complex dimerization subunit type 1 TsaB [Patescibacteria group bacterium]